MAQHDYVIANQSGSSFRSDLNNALSAIVSQNSGSSEPSTTYAYQTWADTTAGVMKMRNGANSAWITLYQLDGEWSTIAFENGTAAAPSIYFKDSGTDTGFYSPGTDQVGISTGGTARLTIDASGNVNIDSNTLYVDAANNRVGLGTSTFGNADADDLTVAGSGNTGITIRSGTTSAANLYFADGTTGDDAVRGYLAYNHSTDKLTIGTNAATAVTIDSSQRVGIGTTSPGATLEVGAVGGNVTAGDLTVSTASTSSVVTVGRLSSTSNDNTTFRVRNRTGSTIFEASPTAITFGPAGTEAARIDTSSRLLVGTSTAPSAGSWAQYAKISTSGNTASSTGGGVVNISTGSAASSGLSAGVSIGNISFSDSTGNEFGLIECRTDATTGSSDYPGRLVFSTTADGASSPTERMRITQAGTVLIGKTTADDSVAGSYILANGQSSFTRSGDYSIYINRLTSDGTLIRFDQANVNEGSISVSGTTVSYNGAHLSRWSQLPDGATREEILRGTVLSNIDEMCGWGEEDNEQLNRMKVSDVVGDPNVSGVFQAWDDDDDTYTDDFYCAMTGDFIIRIAEGVTVQRGDLLMSAGDGTAKPQDDDIIRSKTVAKVTSTHVTCTYDDGSYCVPCVLMAC